ncbi:lysophospholipid acyltransferase family protein [Alkalicoccus chagannorensis]|uniref:lysophospholipid acyltransferase family protein n=1 Tax=Alkalicoccus chagannorensis TaxID=427072 RepID=UPI000416EDFF|nr:lysophospholipid acyltransferase family protein [Alkalicoccus chagannorensis]
MIRTVVWFTYFSLYLLFISPGLIKARLIKDEQKRAAFVHKHAVRWSSSLIRLAGGKVTVSGSSQIPEGPVLFVSCHEGNFDIPVLLSSTGRKTGFISKVEVGKIPLISGWMQQLDCVFLDRADRRQAVRAMREGAEKLKQGSSLVVFPEGTRNKGGEMGQFKKGSFKLAEMSGCTIVPIAITGTSSMMEQHGKRIHPGSVQVTFGAPITLHQEKKVKLEELAAVTESAVADLRRTNLQQEERQQ